MDDKRYMLGFAQLHAAGLSVLAVLFWSGSTTIPELQFAAIMANGLTVFWLALTWWYLSLERSRRVLPLPYHECERVQLIAALTVAFIGFHVLRLL